MNSLTLSIPHISWHSVFIDDFKVYSDFVFADDLWISRDIAFLTIPCVSHDSSFAIDLMSRSWIYWRCRLHTSAVIVIDDFEVYSDSVFVDDLWIISDIAFLTILCVSHDSIFGIDLMRQSWIHWRCRFHLSAVTQYSLTISRCTVSLFSPAIYGSTVTNRFWQFHESAMTLFLLFFSIKC
jgi:hypothetical protein